MFCHPMVNKVAQLYPIRIGCPLTGDIFCLFWNHIAHPCWLDWLSVLKSKEILNSKHANREYNICKLIEAAYLSNYGVVRDQIANLMSPVIVGCCCLANQRLGSRPNKLCSSDPVVNSLLLTSNSLTSFSVTRNLIPFSVPALNRPR